MAIGPVQLIVLGFNHPGVLFGTPVCYNKCAEEFPPLLAAPQRSSTLAQIC